MVREFFVRGIWLLAAPFLAGCAWVLPDLEPSETILEAEVVEVPMQFSGGGFTLELELEDGDRRQMLLDTGASVMALSSEVVEELDLWTIPTLRRLRGATETRTGWMRTGDLDSVVLDGTGEARFQDVGFWVVDLPGAHDGLFGLPLFADCLVTIDGPRGVLRLQRGELPPPDGRRIFEYDLVHQIPVLPIAVGGLTVDVALDTGFDGILSLPQELESQLRWKDARGVPVRVRTVHGESVEMGRQLDGELRLGAISLKDPHVLVGRGSPLLGVAVLRQLRVTFDQANRRVRLEHPAADH